MALPLARIPTIAQRYVDELTMLPLASGYLLFFEANSSDPLEVYADADGNVSLGTEVELDGDGIAPSIFLQPTGYRVEVYSATDVLQTAQSGDQVEDVGQAFLANLGVYLGEGARDVDSDYLVLESDLLITTDAASVANPFVVQLPPAASRTEQITIKHQSANDLEITPDGAEDIDSVSGAYTVSAASSPNFPTVTLVPTTGGWLILSSHGL